MSLSEQPPRGSAEFPRWLNGDITLACGKGYHAGNKGLACKGTINTIGIECPCLCDCHARLTEADR